MLFLNICLLLRQKPENELALSCVCFKTRKETFHFAANCSQPASPALSIPLSKPGPEPVSVVM